jgi:hypothetical protein
MSLSAVSAASVDGDGAAEAGDGVALVSLGWVGAVQDGVGDVPGGDGEDWDGPVSAS